MALSFRHHQLRTLIDFIVGSIPVDDHAIDAPADHVVDLALDLRCIGGAVADVHMVRSSEPGKQVGIHLCRRPGIQQ